MIYLIKASVTRSDYMEDEPKKPEEVFRLVEAELYVDAEHKFKEYYENQGSEYSHSYYVQIEDISKMIT